MKILFYARIICVCLLFAASCAGNPGARDMSPAEENHSAESEAAGTTLLLPGADNETDAEAPPVDNVTADRLPETPVESEAGTVLIEPDPAIAEIFEIPPGTDETDSPPFPEPALPLSEETPAEVLPPAARIPPPAVSEPPEEPEPPAPELQGPSESLSSVPEAPASVEMPETSSSEEIPPVTETFVPLPPEPEAHPNPVPLTGNIDGETVFSRSVRAAVGQLVEVPFRGTGWVYLGETGARGGLSYDSRRLDPEGQSFIFRAEAPGVYTLKFFKQDFIRDFMLNDHVRVTVSDATDSQGTGWFDPPGDRGRVIAEPRWPSAQEEAGLIRRGEQTPVRTQPVPSTRPVSSEPPPGAEAAAVSAPQIPLPADAASAGESPPAAISEYQDGNVFPETMLEKAREEFDAGKTVSAIALLDRYRESFPLGSDELYWLYGRFYEANSPSRNILTSLDYYRRLLNEYPQSGRCDAARRRIAYLERFYINIQ